MAIIVSVLPIWRWTRDHKYAPNDLMGHLFHTGSLSERIIRYVIEDRAPPPCREVTDEIQTPARLGDTVPSLKLRHGDRTIDNFNKELFCRPSEPDPSGRWRMDRRVGDEFADDQHDVFHQLCGKAPSRELAAHPITRLTCWLLRIA